MALLGLKIRIPRFRVRTLLILVAVVAFVLEGGREVVRWHRYTGRYEISRKAQGSYQKAMTYCLERASILEQMALSAPAPLAKAHRDEAAMSRKQAERYGALVVGANRLVEKYETARRTPWRAAPADPPSGMGESIAGNLGW